MRPAHLSILAALGAAVLGGRERDTTAEGDSPLPTGLPADLAGVAVDLTVVGGEVRCSR